MLKTIALTAALALAATVAPLPDSQAEAARLTYRQCVAQVMNSCLIPGPLGPELPDTPAEEAAYEICIENGMAYCATLPDAPV